MLIHQGYHRFLDRIVVVGKKRVLFREAFGQQHKVSLSLDRNSRLNSTEIAFIVTGRYLRVASCVLHFLRLLNDYPIGTHVYQPYVVLDRFEPGFGQHFYFFGNFAPLNVERLYVWNEKVSFLLFGLVNLTKFFFVFALI